MAVTLAAIGAAAIAAERQRQLVLVLQAANRENRRGPAFEEERDRQALEDALHALAVQYLAEN